MPASTSAGEPTPSPTAKHASLTSWATIRPSTRPGASPTRSVAIPSVAKKRSAAAQRRGRRGRRARSARPGRPNGGSRWKPALGPPGSSAASGAASQQQQLRAALQRRVVLGARRSRRSAPAPRRRPPRASATSQPASRRGVEQLGGELALARDHHQPVAAAGLGRLGVGRRARRGSRTSPRRSCGRAGRRRPSAPPAATGASAARRRTARRTTCAIAKPTSIPTRSISSNGPIRKPPASRQMRSTCSGVASRCSTSRSPSSVERPVAAVDEEAGAVGGVDHVLAHRLAGRAGARERRLAERSPATTSTQPHHRRRVEEVHADDALGAAARRRRSR